MPLPEEKRRKKREWLKERLGREIAERGSIEHHTKLSSIHGINGTCKCPNHVKARVKRATIEKESSG